jgi:hypothetical protein
VILGVDAFASSTTTASFTLPAGSYLLTGRVNFENEQGANHGVECTWSSGFFPRDDASVTVPTAEALIHGFATLPLAATLTTAGGDVTQTCAYRSFEGHVLMTGWRVVATTISAPTTLVPH